MTRYLIQITALCLFIDSNLLKECQIFCKCCKKKYFAKNFVDVEKCTRGYKYGRLPKHFQLKSKDFRSLKKAKQRFHLIPIFSKSWHHVSYLFHLNSNIPNHWKTSLPKNMHLMPWTFHYLTRLKSILNSIVKACY